MKSGPFVGLFLLVASAIRLGGLEQIESVQVDTGESGDQISTLARSAGPTDGQWRQSGHLNTRTPDQTRGRRQSSPATRASPNLGLLPYSCPKEPAEPDETEWDGVKMRLHVPDSEDDASISESKSVFWSDVDVDSLVNSSFQLNKPTLIYLGGWHQNKDAVWLAEARENLDELAAEAAGAPVNLLLFDWNAYGFMSYGKSVSMVPHLGLALANFVEQLIDRHQYKADRVHLVAYSLSTHIAGLAGRQLQTSGRGRLAQITAIDPTGVCFHWAQEELFGRDYGLRATDARLVVARHYNMGQLGAGRPIGGVDIFVNGGKSQPRMTIKSLDIRELVGSLGRTLLGNHQRATQHEAASSRARPGECHDVAYECSSYALFKRGQCADCGQGNRSCRLVNTLGSYALNLRPVDYKPNTRMHLMTGTAQFCTYNYQIVARLKPRSSAASVSAFESGLARVRLSQSVTVRPRYRLDEANATHVSFTALLRLGKSKLKFTERLREQSPELIRSLESLSINFMSNISPQARAKSSIRYCVASADRLELVNCSQILNR